MRRFVRFDCLADGCSDLAQFLERDDFARAIGNHLLASGAFGHGDAQDFSGLVLQVSQHRAQIAPRREGFIELACRGEWQGEAVGAKFRN